MSGMSTTTAYTPLESLLLFQSLAANGTDPDAFIRTSDLLQKNVLIRDGNTYDPGRLSSNALQELYLRLLREELKLEAAENDSSGDASPSKKRKIQIPSVSTIKDASEYKDKLPHFVDRLWSRYRDHMIRLIRQDERTYETLTREVAGIERGDWDEKMLRDRTRANRSTSVESRSKMASSMSPILSPAPIVPGKEDEASGPSKSSKDGLQTNPQPTLMPPPVEDRPEVPTISDVLKGQDAAALPPPTEQEPTNPSGPVQNSSQLSPPGQQDIASNDRQYGPSPLQLGQQPQLQPAQQPPSQSGQQRPQDNWKWEQYQAGPAQQPPQYPPNPNYQQFSPSQYPPPYPPYPAQRGAFSGPSGSSPAPLPPQARVPSSPHNPTHPNPVVLPPPHLARGPGSPAAPHLDQLANAAEQQYRATSGSPMLQQGPVPGQPYGQQYSGYSPLPQQYREGRSPSGNAPPPQWNSQHPPQQYPPLPNYGYPPPPPGQRPFAPPELLQAPQRQYNSPYNPSHGARPLQPSSSSSTPRPRGSHDSGIPPQTPASFGPTGHRTGRATVWTPQPSPSTPRTQVPLEPPEYESLSPVLAPSQSITKGTTRKNQASSTKIGGRGGRSGRGARSQQTQSPSRPEEMSFDAMTDVRKVKQESSTPRPDETGDTTADEGPSRGRGGQKLGLSSPRRAPKRKRPHSPDPPPRPSIPPTHVSWTRNFPKISQSALDHIGAHRNASTFAKPITKKDAAGYDSVILRPQDLKSIRSSVHAGYKAGAAIVAGMDNQDPSAASVLLPISEELVPPKGIVNNAQLERELNHMFANAIMFNPNPNRGFGKAFEVLKSVEEGVEQSKGWGGFDEDGVVKDTRAMFADVEAIMGDLRSAERNDRGTGVVEERLVAEAEADGEETDEAGAQGEDHGSGIAKRRRRL